jgi:hypothetical protein
MDRVYVCDDYLEEQFILYAKEHKWWMKESNTLLNDGECASWIGPIDDYKYPFNLHLYIQLDKKYNLFPYIDSFRYYDSGGNKLSTDPEFGDVRCSDTEGGYHQCKKLICASCGESIQVWDDDDGENFYYSEFYDKQYCDNCCEWNEIIGDYIPNNIDTITVYDESFDEIELPEEYVESRIIRINDYHSNGCYFIEINDTYYHRKCFKWSFDLNRYVLVKNEN